MFGSIGSLQALSGSPLQANSLSENYPYGTLSKMIQAFFSGGSQTAPAQGAPPNSVATWYGMSFGQASMSFSGGMFGLLGGTDTEPLGSFRVPLYRDRYDRQAVYEYTEHKAWDYKFQFGQKIHQSEQSVDERVEVINVVRDPVILDLNEDGELGVTGQTDTQVRTNETATSTTSTRTEGRRRITTTTTTREWDLLVNWDNKIDFDVDGDGAVDRTEWLKEGGGDGFLVFDQDGDGTINGRELMNETSLSGEQNAYKSGWDKTRDLFDKNADGILEGDELKDLKIWKDANGDGVTDAGELLTLAELGIVKVDTNSGSFTKQKLKGYQTVKTREELGFVDHHVSAGFGTAYSVGSQLVVGGQTLENFQLASA